MMMKKPILEKVPQIEGLWRFEAETVGYLVVRNGKSMIVDCPSAEFANHIASANLPYPDVILHTQVQEEHCREWSVFSRSKVFVAESSKDIATFAPDYFNDIRTIWPPSREWSTLGEEKYGIAGCVTERPPLNPLNVSGVLTPGEKFIWQDLELEVLALPGSGKRSIGFLWKSEKVCFTGDLIRAGGFLVNIYDVERSYGNPSGWRELKTSLETVLKSDVSMLLPSTGPVIDSPRKDIERLLPLIENPCRVSQRRVNDKPSTINYTPLRVLGDRWRENVEGIFQNTNFGNMILYVDSNGNGLVVDPDFCVWKSWEENCHEFHHDLDMLEKEAGLKGIETALITHYHGDHIQYCDELRRRYGTRICATPDVAAVIETPEKFKYPCTVDWYGFPFKKVEVDEKLTYGKDYHWSDTTFRAVHTPGHCFAHAGFLIPWKGRKTFCTGDVVQYGSGPIGAGLALCYNDNAWPHRSASVTLRQMSRLKPDLVLCGHSQSFIDEGGHIVKDMLEAYLEAEKNLADLICDRNLLVAMTPPGFDEMRPKIA